MSIVKDIMKKYHFQKKHYADTGGSYFTVEAIEMAMNELVERLSPAPAKTAEEVEKTQKFLNPYSVDEKEKYGIFHLGFYSGYTSALQSQPCQTGYSRATVENALQRGVNIAMENLEWDGENHPTFDNITMVNKCNEYLSSLTNKPTE